MDTVIVLAKAPLAGRSKTRLCPPLSFDQAAHLAEAALQDTLACVAASSARRRVIALEGAPGPWLGPGFEVIPQRGDGLDARLAAAFEDVAEAAVAIGMDTPQLEPSLLDQALLRLARPGTDAVLGPALDGGYWAIGLRSPRRELVAGVPMSSPETFGAQLARLTDAGLEVGILTALGDVDRIDDARAAAALAPTSRFASALRACHEQRT